MARAMFRPILAGRPGMLGYKPSTRGRRSRHRAMVVVVSLICAVWWVVPGFSSFGTSKHKHTDVAAAPLGMTAQKTLSHDGGQNAAQYREQVGPNEAANDADQTRTLEQPTESDADSSSTPSRTGSDLNARSEARILRPSRERALTKVLYMLPDELHMRELLRPIDTGGKEKMRELGLRTRQYRKYFSAWEDLHLVEAVSGDISVRDDIIHYLRGADGESLTTLGQGGNSLGGAPLADTLRAYAKFREFLANMANSLFPFTSPYFADHMSLHAHLKSGGRGIVLTAGDKQAPYLLTAIDSFRKLGCKLPIEVMYLGDGDLGEVYQAELEAMPGVITRDMSQMVTDRGWELAGWAAKPFAIVTSSFREVIFIDADSLFFKNPEILFDDPDYQETGALFFRDRLIMPELKRRFLQQLLPKPIPKLAKQSRLWTGESGHMQESGVVVVDKWKHFISLLLVCRLNGSERDSRPGKQGVYELVYGDKETFWIGFLLAGDESFAFHQGDAAIMGESPVARHEQEPSGNKTHPRNYTICGPQLLHLDIESKPLWFNGWLLENKFTSRDRRKFKKLESYLIEPREVREPAPWQLTESNKCCLTSDADKLFEFSEEDRKFLDAVVEHAKKINNDD
ncbi:alpha-1,3-mannosyltransferase [Tolypocladium capitatum]|uniref:Alpha-1,3-mannosyltransferase n=1 Tax=Tolypocladium capitatum TaxID=45235 RepID=A0A2K3QCP7_9HYPO|nr:alpha-1,3-mannosyltransferase [Tolypocladium capitatum]